MPDVMEILAGFLEIVGSVLAITGACQFIRAAFREGRAWGLCCFFIPFAKLLFLIFHWEEAKRPFLMYVIGLGIALCGLEMMPSTG